MFNIRYASVRNLDVSNGEGVGISLFVQGCPFHCYNCFNPETWDFNGGKEWTEEVENEFIELAKKTYIKRISILGGEPLAEENLDGVLNLVNKIRLSCPNKTIWLYSGWTWEQLFTLAAINNLTIDTIKQNGDIIFKNDKMSQNLKKRREIIAKCDILIDGQYIDSQKDITLKFRGSGNQRLIDVQKSLERNKIVLWEN